MANGTLFLNVPWPTCLKMHAFSCIQLRFSNTISFWLYNTRSKANRTSINFIRLISFHNTGTPPSSSSPCFTAIKPSQFRIFQRLFYSLRQYINITLQWFVINLIGDVLHSLVTCLHNVEVLLPSSRRGCSSPAGEAQAWRASLIFCVTSLIATLLGRLRLDIKTCI